MNSDDQFQLAMWRTLSIAAVLIVLAMAGCAATTNNQDNNAIARMVKDGADPIAAGCIIRPSKERNSQCVLVAAGKPVKAD